MRFLATLFALMCGVFVVTRSAEAAVGIQIDLSSQTMRVSANGDNWVWPVSSARSGFVTPRGTYHPYSLQRMHYSRKYHNSPMPYSIFFLGGYAIHGTYAVSELGRPASHGCIRLAPANAASLFAMVKEQGANISISGTPPAGRAMMARAQVKKHHGKVMMASAHSKKHHTSTKVAHRRAPANPLAYAPAPRRVQPLNSWMHDPIMR